MRRSFSCIAAVVGLSGLIGIALLASCGGEPEPDGPETPRLVPLVSGFEPNEAIGCEGSDFDSLNCGEQSQAHTGILFYEAQPNTDWRTWALDSPLAALGINYQTQAPASSRFARIIEDPTAAGNHVLHFQLRDATIDAGYEGHQKGRVQTQASFDPAESEIYSRQRVYFHPDLARLLTYPDPNGWWLGTTFQEMRAGAPTPEDAASLRFSLNIGPDIERGQFFIALIADTRAAGADNWVDLWSVADANAAIPLGQWLIVELAYRAGSAESGRLAIVLTVEGEAEPLVVFDVHQATTHPEVATEYGINLWNGPQKLYTSDNVINHIREAGGSLQAYFDDFEFRTRWPEGWNVPPATAEAELAL